MRGHCSLRPRYFDLCRCVRLIFEFCFRRYLYAGHDADDRRRQCRESGESGSEWATVCDSAGPYSSLVPLLCSPTTSSIKAVNVRRLTPEALVDQFGAREWSVTMPLRMPCGFVEIGED